MTTNELIEQIGGRERLEELADENTICRVSWDERIAMARALMSVLDAQEKPSAWIINCNSARINFAETEKTSVDKIIEECRENGTDIDVTPLYTTPPAASAPEGYKLVPIEPSKEMLLASKRYKAKNKVPTGPGVYRAMIAAAPAPGGDGG